MPTGAFNLVHEMNRAEHAELERLRRESVYHETERQRLKTRIGNLQSQNRALREDLRSALRLAKTKLDWWTEKHAYMDGPTDGSD